MSTEKRPIQTDKADLPILFFPSGNEWRQWLDQNFDNTPGVWLQFYKKGSGVVSITYNDALDEALCYGWIDGQVKKFDEQSYIQRFTPRRARSIWSKRNIAFIARLEKEGRMHPSGWKEANAAKADGRWEKAYDSPTNMEVPDDFIQALSSNAKAQAFFETLTKANKYAISWRLQTAKKPETREKRMKQILEMLAQGEKFHN
jgi:uncharacterized protein YdeI (YjbR/CyaY-like superfamily)